MIYLACDHRGFGLKEGIKKLLGEQGTLYEDMGDFFFDEDDDYVDFARAAAEKIAENPAEHKGIFLCGSGHGMDMVANKYRGIRAALCWNPQVTAESRKHEDGNVLVLPADWLDEVAAKEIVLVWLGASFSDQDPHMRRLKKIEEMEHKNFCG